MELDPALVEKLGGLDAVKSRIVAFRDAVEAHKVTIDQPAPVEAEFIERLAREGVDADAITVPAPPPPPPPPPPPTYRDLRKEAYIKELGKVADTSFENTTGDMLDIVITQLEAMRLASGVKATDEYAARIAKIAEIKQRFPKA